jgi:hypothetical protein
VFSKRESESHGENNYERKIEEVEERKSQGLQK